MIHENAWTLYGDKEIRELEKLSADYIEFLNNGKTERECACLLAEMAEKNGYRDLKDVIAKGEKLAKGDKVYADNMGKAFMMLNIGEDIMRDGMNILGAHIDSPRLDLKQNPLYESEELSYFDTHYYGGIKKYQYVTLPLALHGVVVRPDGTKININIGEKESDPVFFVSDLLIHLSQDQLKKPAADAVEGDNLDIVVGSRPLKGEEKDAVKAAVLKFLKDESVRVEIMRTFGFFPTESNRHDSEYLPYFRRTPELMEKYSLAKRTVPDKLEAKRVWAADGAGNQVRDPAVPVEPLVKFT